MSDVERCVTELQELFRGRAQFKVRQTVTGRSNGRVEESAMIVIEKHSKYFYGATLGVCMAQVRKWASAK